MGMLARGSSRATIELPLAVPVIFAGIRTAAVQVVSGAVLAAYIGGGGLGDFITAGIAMMARAAASGRRHSRDAAVDRHRLLFGHLQTATHARAAAWRRTDATRMIELRHLDQALSRRRAPPRSTDVTLTVRRGRGVRADRPVRLRQDDDDAR